MSVDETVTMDPDQFIMERIREGKTPEAAYGMARGHFGVDYLRTFFVEDPTSLIHEAPVLRYLAKDDIPVKDLARSLLEAVGGHHTAATLLSAYPLPVVEEAMGPDKGYVAPAQEKLEKLL